MGNYGSVQVTVLYVLMEMIYNLLPMIPMTPILYQATACPGPSWIKREIYLRLSSPRLNGSKTGLVHQSKGIRLTQSRLQLNHLITQRKANLQIIDKKSEKAVAGTRVILSFDNQLS